MLESEAANFLQLIEIENVITACNYLSKSFGREANNGVESPNGGRKREINNLVVQQFPAFAC